MNVKQIEWVGGLECSTWRGEEPARVYERAFGWPFLTALCAGFVVLFGWSEAILWAIRSGQKGLSQGLSFGLLVALYAVILAPALLRKRRRATSATSDLVRPDIVPRYALPMVAIVRGDSTRGWSAGWFWFDGPWAVFEGERFDFRLAKRDFRLSKRLALVGTEPRLLELPKALPTTRLLLRVGFVESGRVAKMDYDKEQLQSTLQAWAEAAEPRERSLFPPLSYPPNSMPRFAWSKILFAGLFVGFAVLCLVSSLPEAPKDRLPGLCIAAAVMIPMLLAFAQFGEYMNRRSNESAIRAFIEKNSR